MPAWYVSYRKGRSTAMQITEDREAAITAACALLNRGFDVTEIAPSAGSRTLRLDAVAVREIHHFREYGTE